MEGENTSNVDKTTSKKTSKKTTKTRVVALRSKAWAGFKAIRDANNKITHGECKDCKALIKYDSGNIGTSPLRRHLEVCPENANNKQSNQPNQTQLSVETNNDGSTIISTWKFDQLLSRKALVEMVVIDELSYKFVEGEGFRKFMSVVCPRFQIPSRWTVARDIGELFHIGKEQLKCLLKNTGQRVCLTTDTWTSCQRVNYMCLTAHYIDLNWKLQKRIINFIPISSHRGEAIGLAIEKCLRDWGIDKVFTITVDNASSNDVAMGNLKKKMANWDLSVLKGEHLHMRCVAHILNLVVVDGLKEINESVAKVRNAIKYIRNSPARLQKFKDCVELERIESKSSLCLDVPTRWNSTYRMLSVVEKFERAFERYDEQDPYYKIDLEYKVMVNVAGVDGNFKKEVRTFDGRPKAEDWQNCRKYASLLEYFYNLTLKISGTQYVTSNTFFHEIVKLHFFLNKMKGSADIDQYMLGSNMKIKFDKYWGNPQKMNKLFFIAVVLDPRYKLEYVEFMLNEVYGSEIGPVIVDEVKQLMQALFMDYKGKSQPQVENVEQSEPVSISKSVENVSGGQEAYDELMSRYKKKKTQSGSSDGITLELEKYYREDCESDKSGFSILDWWKQNSHSHRFPILSQIARDVLAIPISTVASESVFSTGGRVLDSFRSSLTPKSVEALICTQNWIQSSTSSINVEEDLEDLENLEKELSKYIGEGSSSTPMEF